MGACLGCSDTSAGHQIAMVLGGAVAGYAIYKIFLEKHVAQNPPWPFIGPYPPLWLGSAFSVTPTVAF